jgi:hypothetical protein
MCVLRIGHSFFVPTAPRRWTAINVGADRTHPAIGPHTIDSGPTSNVLFAGCDPRHSLFAGWNLRHSFLRAWGLRLRDPTSQQLRELVGDGIRGTGICYPLYLFAG